MTDLGHNAGAAQLRAFVERIERVEEEIKELNADKSDIYKEARAQGFDVKVMRKVVAARKIDAAEREEADALFDLYWQAVNGVVVDVDAGSSRARAREDSEMPPAERSVAQTDAGKSDGDRNPVDAALVTLPVGEKPAIFDNSPEPASTPPESTQNEDAATAGAPAPAPSSDSNPPAASAGAATEAPAPHVPVTVQAAGAPIGSGDWRRALRPHCLNPDLCAGYGDKHCHSCLAAVEGAGA